MAARPSWRLAAVVLIALVGLSALAAALGDDGPADAPAGATPAPERFLDAWARSRASTYRTVSEVSRVSNSTGAELTDRVIVAQRPPDRLAIDGDGAIGLVDGRRIACVFRDERLDCEDAAAERSYEDDVVRQLRTLEAYVTGPDPLYAVTALAREDLVGDCFDLALTQPELVAPPLGISSRYCFDPDLGAPTLTRIERVEADDDTRTVELSGEVTDADLDPASALLDP